MSFTGSLEVFPNTGFLIGKLEEEILAPIKKEVRKIEANFDAAVPYNPNLAGHINHEYELFDSIKPLNNILKPLVEKYDETFKEIHYATLPLNKTLPLTVDHAWVNFQRKNEFNPPHDHAGVLSFVLYIQVPFDIEDESALFQKMKPLENRAANFTFIYANAVGTLRTHGIPVDRKFENAIILFPSKMLHCVNPFYTSDEYRISVSGNLKFNVP